VNTGQRLFLSCVSSHICSLARTGGTYSHLDVMQSRSERRLTGRRPTGGGLGGGCMDGPHSSTSLPLTETGPYWSTWPAHWPPTPPGQCVSDPCHACPYPWPFAPTLPKQQQTRSLQVPSAASRPCLASCLPLRLRLQNLACTPDHVRAWKGTRPAS
jgi:hypothetical protein